MEELSAALGPPAAAPATTQLCTKPGNVCPLCESPIELGTPILPVARRGENNKLLWAHSPCAEAQQEQGGETEWLCPPVCRHWRRGGKCPYSEQGMCAFDHPEEERGKGELDDGKRSWGGKRRRLRNKQSAGVFRCFLIHALHGAVRHCRLLHGRSCNGLTPVCVSGFGF